MRADRPPGGRFFCVCWCHVGAAGWVETEGAVVGGAITSPGGPTHRDSVATPLRAPQRSKPKRQKQEKDECRRGGWPLAEWAGPATGGQQHQVGALFTSLVCVLQKLSERPPVRADDFSVCSRLHLILHIFASKFRLLSCQLELTRPVGGSLKVSLVCFAVQSVSFGWKTISEFFFPKKFRLNFRVKLPTEKKKSSICSLKLLPSQSKDEC